MLRRVAAGFGAVVVLGVVVGVVQLLVGTSPGHEDRTPAHHGQRMAARIVPWTLIATVHIPTPGYASPRSLTPTLTVPPSWAGAPSALPVVASQPGWIKVRVVARPPGQQTAWIRYSSATLARTPFRVVVDISLKRLLLFRRGELVMCAPAGIGTPQDPTPLGHYFVALLARSPRRAYGPFVIVTSAFANTVTDWEQSGDPMITIEGPLDSASAIGTIGARVTTGGIRLLDRDLDRLRDVPPGTALDIVNKVQLAPARHDHRMCQLSAK